MFALKRLICLLGILFASLWTLAPPACSAAPRAPAAEASSVFKIIPPSATPDLTFARQGPENGILLSGSGSLISFCPRLACVTRPSADHQRAAAVFASMTRDDGHSEEQTVAIETTIRTGLARVWAPKREFERGDNVAFSGARNAVYRATVGGMSASGGSGPTGQGADIVDGTVHWAWVNDAAIDAKVGLYNEMATLAGGGASWGQANNVHLQPGATPSFNVNTELDFSNDAAECIVGRTNCYNLVVATNGRFRSTSGLSVLSENASNYATHWGLRLSGSHLASDADIAEDAEAPIGLGIGLFGGHVHQRAAILDASGGGVSYLITHDHSVATIEDASNSPASIDISGKHSIAGILEQSKSQNGLALNGIYAGAQIIGKGFLVDTHGAIEAQSLEAKQRLLIPAKTPPSSRSSCVRGETTFSDHFLYVCVADNLWRRASLQDF